MPERFAFPNPFLFNHCMVLAVAHAASMNADGALRLAEQMRQTPVVDYTERMQRECQAYRWDPICSGSNLPSLLSNDGRAFGTEPRNFERWAQAANLRIVRRVTYDPSTAPTLDEFVTEHPVGSWVVIVPGHAVAVVAGVIYGWYSPNHWALVAYEVEQGGR